MSYDWSEFKVHTFCNSSVADVFAMWATSSGLEKFFIKSCSFVDQKNQLREKDELAQRGDSYTWRWIHDYELKGEVTETNNIDSISYTFGSMEITITISDVGGKSLVKLRQFNIPHESEEAKAANHLNCRSCWVFFLTNMKSVLESGHDLRESDPNQSDCVAIHFEHL